MTTKTIESLLVGGYHRPPAKLLLEHLPAGTPLLLVSEPDNPYDSSALKVFIEPEMIPESQHQALQDRLPLCGYTLEQVMSGGAVQLGYVAASNGKPLQKAPPGYVGNQEFLAAMAARPEANDAALAFTPAGAPAVMLRCDELEDRAGIPEHDADTDGRWGK